MIDLAAYKTHLKRKESPAGAHKEGASLMGDASENGYQMNAPTAEQHLDEDPPDVQHRTRLLKVKSGIFERRDAQHETLFLQCGYIHEDDEPTDEQLMLCDSHVRGYCLRGKAWGEIIFIGYLSIELMISF